MQKANYPFGMIENSSCKTWMATLFFFYLFSIHHIKLSRFTNHTVQKFFKVQILWLGISWYIHFIFWMTKIIIKKSTFLFVQSGSTFMAHKLIQTTALTLDSIPSLHRCHQTWQHVLILFSVCHMIKGLHRPNRSYVTSLKASRST